MHMFSVLYASNLKENTKKKISLNGQGVAHEISEGHRLLIQASSGNKYLPAQEIWKLFAGEWTTEYSLF